ncbi:hypothetical protein HA402_006008 [Bradysia odoriphaga]|nr:hypothetical protein HA402_006008 [Bradysia odoriphaga]
MNRKLDAYLLSKSLITIGSGKLAKTFGSGIKKPTSSIKQHSPQRKSGEIFRSKNGIFSFSCTICGAVCETCSSIVDHINSHFVKETSDTFADIIVSDSPLLAQPEFISTGELKSEVDFIEPSNTSNGLSHKVTNKKFPPKFTNGSSCSKSIEQTDESNPAARVVRIIRRKRKEIRDSAGDVLDSAVTTKFVQPGEIKCNVVEELNSEPSTKIVRIIKRKRRKFEDVVGEESKSAPTTKVAHRGPSEIKYTANEESNSASATKIVRIIKRKRSEVSQAVGDDPVAERATTIAEQKCDEIRHSADEESDSVQMTLPADEDSSAAQTNKIVKVVKLKRISFRPGSTASTKGKVLGNAAPTSVSQIPEDLDKTETELKAAAVDTDTKSNESVPIDTPNLNEVDRPAPVRSKNRSCCYQCEMEPRVYEPSDPRRHICLFCPTWFPNHIDFENHVQTIHGKDPNYVVCKEFYCYVCEKCFDFRAYLSGHMKMHKETADFLCATCGNSFKTKSRLTEHMKKHDDQTYICDECGKVFKQFARLRKHLWCHNTNLSFVCDICTKAFKMKRYLDLHMAVHKEANINCRYCDATFHFNSVRRAHEKSRHSVI